MGSLWLISHHIPNTRKNPSWFFQYSRASLFNTLLLLLLIILSRARGSLTNINWILCILGAWIASHLFISRVLMCQTELFVCSSYSSQVETWNFPTLDPIPLTHSWWYFMYCFWSSKPYWDIYSFKEKRVIYMVQNPKSSRPHIILSGKTTTICWLKEEPFFFFLFKKEELFKSKENTCKLQECIFYIRANYWLRKFVLWVQFVFYGCIRGILNSLRATWVPTLQLFTHFLVLKWVSLVYITYFYFFNSSI